jgi:hypothetical protein
MFSSSPTSTTVSRFILSPSGGFAVSVTIILAGAILPRAVAQPPDAAQLRTAAERRGQRAESFLRPLDTNRNGILEASEVNEQAQSYLAHTAERYGVPATLPLSLDQYRNALIAAYIRVRSNGGTGTQPSGGSSAGGFGLAQNTSSVSGFGNSASNTSSTPSVSNAVAERYRSYAANMLKRYDKNGNGALDHDEWSQLRGEWWKSADANGDGTITGEEIISRLAGYRSRFRSSTNTSTTSGSSTTSSNSSSSSSPTPSSTSSNTTTSTPTSTSAATTNSSANQTPAVVRSAYRFLTPTERLPAGLPEWFARRDANGDGQVTLAEFSDALSEEVAAEFAKHDLNNDGVVTPQECLQAARGR